ncbi:nucleoside permease [soil metagenome]
MAGTVRKKHTAVRLAVMMFLQYGGLGAWSVPLSRWLGTSPTLGGLGFSPSEIGGIYSTLAIGGLIAPLMTGILADRTFTSEKLLGFLNALMAVLCVAAGLWCERHSGMLASPESAFWPLFGIMLVYCVCIYIGITTATAKTLRNLMNPTSHFGRVRLIGTLGWVVTVIIACRLFEPLSSQPFFVAACSHALLTLFMPWLPHTPPLGKGKPLSEVIGLPAIKLFKDPSFVLFIVVAFVTAAMLPFYTVFGNVCCGSLGIEHPEVKFSTSQIVEMACMFSIPFIVNRIGLKMVMVVGLAAWALRNAVFMSVSVPWILLLGIPLQGLAYTYFSIVGSLYIDREAPPHLRAGAQSLLTFFASGPGTLTGNYLAGMIVAANTVDHEVIWTNVWLVPAIGCSIITVVFLLFFHEPKPATTGSPLRGEGSGVRGGPLR